MCKTEIDVMMKKRGNCQTYKKEQKKAGMEIKHKNGNNKHSQ